ncbi:MAG: hypothetical protein JWP81_3397 [Ferruginibacter sp.]|nr:hypothetical protein [Ferruginibacter sp.]
MKVTSTILPDFINDFNMEVFEMGVCFDAVVNFNLPFQSFNMESEVHMEAMLSGSFDTVYLLNPDIKIYKMPTFFNMVNHQFIYPKFKGLIIAGNMPIFGRYTVSIFPTSQFCSEQTLNELKAKKLN